MRILWITGPPGVGKSTAAWRLYRRLPVPVSHVDIDQLGMLMPAPADDPDRTAVKLAALRRLASVHRRAGSGLLLVSGVSAPGGELPTVVLRASGDAIRERLLGRGADADYIRRAVEDAEEPAPADAEVVDTTGRGIDEVVAEIERIIPSVDGARAAPPTSAGAALPRILWIRSSRAVGASSVGFGMLGSLAADGVRTAFLDAAQLGFLEGGEVRIPDAIAAVGTAFAAAGVEMLVAVGPLTDEDRAELAGAAPIDVVRLIASPGSIAERVRSRASGGPVHLAGDDLRGLVGGDLDAAVDGAIRDAAAMPDLRGELVVDTSDATVEAAVARVREALGELAGKITDR